MTIAEFANATLFLFVLLNPFLLIVYLADPVSRLTLARFATALMGAGIIGIGIFCVFALIGDLIFVRILHARFASFQVFGGLVFLLIALQFVFRGPGSIEMLRGDARHLSGSIAMPILVGPGTLSASVVIGKRLNPLAAFAAISLSVAASVGIMVLLKMLHDFVLARNAKLVERYTDVAGRILALYAGTFSVEMILTGLTSWEAS